MILANIHTITQTSKPNDCFCYSFFYQIQIQLKKLNIKIRNRPSGPRRTYPGPRLMLGWPLGNLGHVEHETVLHGLQWA